MNNATKQWTVRTSSPRTTKAREVSPPVDVRLRCAIGHEYSGTVRIIQENGHDMDGDEFWHGPMNDYDPATCVVCGLRTYAAVKT